MERTYTVEELFGALRRRWKRAAVVAAVVFAIAALLVARAPATYTARAMVMVEPLHPHPDLIIPVISTTLEEKVKSVRAQVYARGVMASVIDELNLYPTLREKEGMDGAVEQLRLDTEVHPDGDSAFGIVVKARDAQLAAKAANRLAELFIEGNLQVRQGQVTRTRDIIGAKLTELRGQLDKVEQNVATFKKGHAGELPELIESRMRERDQLGKQIELESTFVQTAQQRLDLLGTQPFGKDTDVGRAEDEEQLVRAQYAALASSLTPDHPDVQRMGRQLGEVRARLEQARARAAANDLEARRMNQAVKRGQNHIDRLQQRIAAIDKVVAQGPQVAAQLSLVSRDADLLRAKVTQLISKKAEAEITADLEAKSAPSEFRVLESAVPATLPGSPNRPLALVIALLAALAIGGAMAMAQELSDRSLRGAADAGDWLALPVLATIPRLAGSSSPARMLALPGSSKA